jgi:glycosyltransferase involved in cell wall biosynthesis
MRIAFFSHGYLPWDPYGVPRYVERLSNCLTSKGHQVFIITVGRPNLPKIESPRPNLTVYRTTYSEPPISKCEPLWSLTLYTVGSLTEASKLVSKEDIQIIHGHTDVWGGLQCALVSTITKKPCVVTLHGSALDKYSEGRLPLHLRFLNRADFVICQKMSAINKLISWKISRRKLVFLPKGCIDVRQFAPAERDLSKSVQVVTFIGRLTDYKGPRLLLEAAPQILSNNPSTLIQFVGDGDLRALLEAKARSMGLNNQVKFLGLRPDINEILRSSNVFVSISPYQNATDLALLEAMATGVPIVATNVAGTRRVVKDGKTGLLAECDPKDIACKVSTLLSNKRLADSLSKNERKLIKDEYSLDEITQKHEEIYRLAIDSGNSPQSTKKLICI